MRVQRRRHPLLATRPPPCHNGRGYQALDNGRGHNRPHNPHLRRARPYHTNTPVQHGLAKRPTAHCAHTAKVLPSRRVHRYEDPPSQGVAVILDGEGTTAPRYIPAWVLPQEDLDILIAAGTGAAPDIIYARGVPADPSPEIDSFNRKDWSLMLLEIGFCRDLCCHM